MQLVLFLKVWRSNIKQDSWYKKQKADTSTNIVSLFFKFNISKTEKNLHGSAIITTLNKKHLDFSKHRILLNHIPITEISSKPYSHLDFLPLELKRYRCIFTIDTSFPDQPTEIYCHSSKGWGMKMTWKLFPLAYWSYTLQGKWLLAMLFFISATSYNHYCYTVVCLEEQTLTWVGYFYLLG